MEFKLSTITQQDVQQSFNHYLPYPVCVKSVSFFPEDIQQATTRYDGVLLVDISASCEDQFETLCFNISGLVNIISPSHILLKEANDFNASQLFDDAIKFTRAFYRMMTEKFGIDFYDYAKKYQLENMKLARQALMIQQSRVKSRLFTLKHKIQQKSAELKQQLLEGIDVSDEVKTLREKTDIYLELRKHPETEWQTEEKKYKYHNNHSRWLTDTKKQMLKIYHTKTSNEMS